LIGSYNDQTTDSPSVAVVKTNNRIDFYYVGSSSMGIWQIFLSLFSLS